MRTLVVVLLFSIPACQKPLNLGAVTGFWIPEQMNWESTPSGFELDSLSFAYSSTWYFSSDSNLKIFHWMLLKAESVADLRNDVLKLRMNKQTFVKSTILTAKTRQMIRSFDGINLR